MKKCYVFIISLMLIKSFAYAQRITVEGTIQDKVSGEALVGANVYAKSDYSVGTSANDQGEFVLSLPNADTLVITFIGYQEQRIAISDHQSVTVQLAPKHHSMEEVVVQAPSLVAEEFTVKKISRLEIYKNPTAKADPLLAVNSLPSATTLDESANISLRGSTPTETGIFLNDVPIYDAVRFSQLNGIGTFSIFNTSLIGQVEVFPSNPPLEVGNTTAGLVSLRTVEEAPDYLNGSVSLSLANIGLQLSVPTRNHSSVMLFSNYQPSGALKSVNETALETLDKFNSIDFGLHIVQKLGENTSLKLFNYTIKEGYRADYQHASYQGDFMQDKLRNFTVVNYEKRVKQAVFTLNHGFSSSKARYRVGNLDAEFNHQDVYFSANYTRSFRTLLVKSGITYDRRQNNFGGDFPQYGYAMRPEHPSYSFDTLMRYQLPEVYVYGKQTLSERLKVGAGVRRSLPVKSVRDYWSYQLNASYAITDAQSLKLSTGKYHMHKLPDGDGSGDFLSSTQVSLDYRYQKDNIEVSAATFYKNTDRGAIRDRVYGAELATQVRWTPRLNTQVAYTYLQATEKQEISYRSPYDLSYFVNASLAYQLTNWTLTSTLLFRQGSLYQPVISSQPVASLNVYEPQYAELANAVRLPDYGIVNVSVSRIVAVSERINAVGFANISNVLNRDNVRSFAYNSDYSAASETLFSQRTIYFGVMLNFR